jgi:DDE superfamily endonuclease
MVITNEDKVIKYLSDSYTGKWHDYKILKDILEPGLEWFKNVTLKVDLGYLGIKKDYKASHIEIPHKKPRLKPLTETQKDENKKMASERVKVEHSIGGMKRYRILSDRLRMHLIDFYDEVLGVCAGLWNFYLAN